MKISARWSAPLLLAAWIVPLAGCGDSTATPIVTGPTWSDANAPDPTAGTWKTYVLATPSAHRPAAPAVQGTAAFNTDLAQAKGYVAERNASVNNLITYWNGGASRRWNEYHRHIITLAKPNPVRASRNLALASVGMYDALVASYDAKYFYRRPHPGAYDSTITIFGAADHSPSYIDEQIAMGRTACDVLANLYPAYADSFVALFNAQYLAELHNGNHFPSDIAAASGLGGQIAQDVLTRAAGDNSGAVNHGTAPVGPGYWVPTPPAFVQSPVEPAAGLWATWVVPTGSSLRPTPPPAFGSSEFTAETREVYDVGKSLTDDRRQIALFWAEIGRAHV